MKLGAQNYDGVTAKGFQLSVWYFYGNNPYPELICYGAWVAKDGVSVANIWMGKNDKIWVKLSCEYGDTWIPLVRFNQEVVVKMPIKNKNVSFIFWSM